MINIVRMQFGSHLYGTNTPQSDLDFKGVFIPDGRDILLGRVRETLDNRRKKEHGEKNAVGEVEEEYFALRRYLELLSEGQTVALDMIFAPWSHLVEWSPVWQSIVECRERLLTRRSAAFVGYCRQQANKYGIKGSRVAAARAAMELFAQLLANGATRKLNEFDSEIRAWAIGREHVAIIPMEQPHGRPALDHLEVCNKKIPFTNTLKSAHELFKRVFDEYGQRALAAETGVGIDWKALSHAVRVGNEALELLRTAHITFPLVNRQHIMDIKLGRLPYEAVAKEIEILLEEVEYAASISTLPDKPDYALIDDIVVQHYHRAVMAEIVP